MGIHQVGSQTVNVTWPYTNSGFVLQEATTLSATSWQPSLLLPTFDSNSAVFSVSVPAASADRFYRLAQPADVRGIYVYSSDVAQISTSYASALTNALKATGVDGLVLVLGWNALEPSNGGYNWTKLDQWMDLALALGRKVDLAIPAGVNTPAWLFQSPATGGAGATPLNFTVSPHEGQTGNCIAETIAAPWDTSFLTAWNRMLTTVSAHLKSKGTYSHLTLLRLTGVNRTTDELRLPAETPGSTGLACVSNAPAIWQAAGYTPAALLAGWSNILASFQTSFPDKSFSVAIIPTNAFPAIDTGGHLLTGNIPDANQPLLALAAQKLSGRLVVQFNYLMYNTPATPAVSQAAQNYGTLAAFQSNNWFGSSGGGAACGGTVSNPVACNEATYLAELEIGIYPLGPTPPLRSQYLEVFPANVLEFTNAIWQAHTELLAP